MSTCAAASAPWSPELGEAGLAEGAGGTLQKAATSWVFKSEKAAPWGGGGSAVQVRGWYPMRNTWQQTLLAKAPEPVGTTPSACPADSYLLVRGEMLGRHSHFLFTVGSVYKVTANTDSVTTGQNHRPQVPARCGHDIAINPSVPNPVVCFS